MAFTSWCTGMLPSNERSEDGAKLALGSLFTTTVAASILFFGVDEASMSAYQNDMLASSGFSNNVVATAKEVAQKDIPPPRQGSYHWEGKSQHPAAASSSGESEQQLLVRKQFLEEKIKAQKELAEITEKLSEMRS